MCSLCDATETGEFQSCQDCGALICFDVEGGDEVLRPARVTASGDLYCDRHAREHDRAEEEQEGDPWDYVDWNEPLDETEGDADA